MSAGAQASTRRRRRQRGTPTRGTATPRRSTERAGARRVQAHHRRLRLLDLPAQRHHHVLRASSRPTRCWPTRPPAARAARDLFDLRNVAIETACLLLSSFTCGLAGIGAQARRNGLYYGAHGGDLRARRRRSSRSSCTSSPAWSRRAPGPTRSAFLSAFFTLVGCHGLHVTAGLLWLLTMMAQVFAKGYRADILRRLLCFSLFWHALDIIWVALFTSSI